MQVLERKGRKERKERGKERDSLNCAIIFLGEKRVEKKEKELVG
jgi:hypothetical protein